MNYEFLTLIFGLLIGIGSISTSIIVALNGVKKSQLDALTKWAETLEEKNKVLQKRVDDLEGANEILKKERETSRQIRQDAENQLFKTLQEKIDLLTENSEKLEKENIEFRKTIDKLQKDLELSINHRRERDEQILTLQRKIDEMQKILIDRDCQIEKMAIQIENLQNKK